MKNVFYSQYNRLS